MYDTAKNSILVKMAKSGDDEALSKLVSDNLGLVKSIAVRFLGRGQELDDLVQIGVIGMLKAAKSFDESYNTAFSTYAVHMIVGEIKRFLRDDGLIKVSRDIKQRGYILRKATEDFMMKNAREPTVDELCSVCGFEREEVAMALEASYPSLSLQEKAGDDDSSPLEELVGEDNIDSVTEKIALSQAIEKLPKEERFLIDLRYRKGLTQSESASRLGITQVKVSRTEKKIIEKLRNEMGTQ